MTAPQPRIRPRILMALYILCIVVPCFYAARDVLSDSPWLTLAMMVALALTALVLFIFNTPPAVPLPPASEQVAPPEPRQPLASAQQVEAFFRDPAKPRHSLTATFAELGEPATCADWDFGRREYAWESAGTTVRLYTRNSTVNEATVRRRWRIGAREQIIWTNPAPDELGRQPR